MLFHGRMSLHNNTCALITNMDSRHTKEHNAGWANTVPGDFATFWTSITPLWRSSQAISVLIRARQQSHFNRAPRKLNLFVILSRHHSPWFFSINWLKWQLSLWVRGQSQVLLLGQGECAGVFPKAREHAALVLCAAAVGQQRWMPGACPERQQGKHRQGNAESLAGAGEEV